MLEQEDWIMRLKVYIAVDPDLCPRCKKRNTKKLDGETYECYDCGRLYRAENKKLVIKGENNEGRA